MITTCDTCRRAVPLVATRGLGERELGYDVLTVCLDTTACTEAAAALEATPPMTTEPPAPLPADVPF